MNRKSLTTVDKIERYCRKHNIDFARPRSGELWIFLNRATAGGPKTFAHRLLQETTKLLSVESVYPAKVGNPARPPVKVPSPAASDLKGSKTNYVLKYPKMLQYFRCSAGTLTDDGIKSMLDEATDNAVCVISLMERHSGWLRDHRKRQLKRLIKMHSQKPPF